MKKILTVLAICFSLAASAQVQTVVVDSSKFYSYGITGIRANDWEQLFPLLVSDEKYEDCFQLLQTKYKPAAPTGTSVLTLDSVRNDALIGIYTYVMQVQNGLSGAWTARIRTALKAAPTANYVITQCNAIDAIWNTQQNAIQAEGQRRYKRQRN